MHFFRFDVADQHKVLHNCEEKGKQYMTFINSTNKYLKAMLLFIQHPGISS